MKQKPSSRKKALRATGKKVVRASSASLPAGYGELLDELKRRVRAAQIKAAVAANRELIQLYWDIGRMIVERQERESWGKGIVERLAADIQRSFPGIKGFSPVNV
jgi:predicted nuclease of restriction endonuclease-like (RecB) superfamily